MMAYLIEQFLDVREALEAERNKSTPSVRELEWLEERYERTKAAIDSAFEGRAMTESDEKRLAKNTGGEDMSDAMRPGDFSDAEDALQLLAACRDSSPESLQVHIALAPRVMYISWPNKDYQPGDVSSPAFHCVCLYLAEDNIVAKAMGAGRDPFSPINEGKR